MYEIVFLIKKKIKNYCNIELNLSIRSISASRIKPMNNIDFILKIFYRLKKVNKNNIPR